MKLIKALPIIFVFLNQLTFAQEPPIQKYKLSGNVIEKASRLPIEYATLTVKLPNSKKIITGGITDAKGNFAIDVPEGTYDIYIEFISFKTTEIKNKEINKNLNLGEIILSENAAQLNEVVVQSEKTTVEIKLDKKIFNVGNDLAAKGGTVSDVLANIPSVSVDVEGNVSLRGNENVKILIDGKPSSAININDALRLIPADAIDKVEVMTNPSARYDAEGGGGILNIILKRGKNLGVNGNLVATVANPENNGLNGTLNYKTKKINLFTNQGYNFRYNPGNVYNETKYLNTDNSIQRYIIEKRDLNKYDKAYNGNFGIELTIDKNTTWTNVINYRKNNGDNNDNVFQNYYTSTKVYQYTKSRVNKNVNESDNIEYTTNFTKKFKKQGHKFTIDGLVAYNNDKSAAAITETGTDTSISKLDNTSNNQKQNRALLQSDYVLPLGKEGQFEAGYRGDFTTLTTDYKVINDGITNTNLTNTLEYKEKINAVYSQYGFKKSKISVLFGLRYENSIIDINQIASFNTKKYDNFFPSAFFTYDISDSNSVSISYSKRIQRPRGRLINPFNNLTSNINIFSGNPDLNPAITDSYDFGIIKRWSRLTLNSSLYYNQTSDLFQFVRKESGTFVNGTPLIITSPINAAKEYRTGFDFTLNYTPLKWWKLNANINVFKRDLRGEFSYTNFNNVRITQDFNNSSNSWFGKIISKITLPKKIDWQTNISYMSPQNTPQGEMLGIFTLNLAFSKDILKDKGTLSLNINDVLNSNKRIMEAYIPSVLNSRAEMQFRVRQIILSLTYRFNKSKSEKEKQAKRNPGEGGGDMDF